MSGSLHAEPTKIPSTTSDIDGCLQRRIRHITSIQVRNLTPFPVRDAFASALSQPSQSQFTIHGHLSDDLDLTISRKRSRRISANSFNTARSRKSEDGMLSEETQGYVVGSPEQRGRLKRGSRVSFSGAGSFGPSTSTSSSGRTVPSSAAAPTIRPNRPRTSSMASSSSSQFHVQAPSAAVPPSSTGSLFFPAMLPDNSQKGLEKVIKSRLVETFITITVPPPSSLKAPSRNNRPTSPSPSIRSRPSTPPHAPPLVTPLSSTSQKAVHSVTRKGSKVTLSRPSDSSNRSTQGLSTRLETTTPRPRPPSTFSRTPSSSSRPSGKTQVSSPSFSSKSSSPLLPSSVIRTPASATATPTSPPAPTVPNYISPVHRPSTNPSFTIDPRSKFEFAEWTDVSGAELKVEVWGKVGPHWHGLEDAGGTVNVGGKGKEKEVERLENKGDTTDWRVFEEWNTNLADLVPLPEDLASHPSHLPSNTLLMTLAPYGQKYYVPPTTRSSRPPSPSTGYNSDPESTSRDVRGVGELILPAPLGGFTDTEGDVNFSRRNPGRRRNGNMSHSSREGLKTAGWQDLLKLVTLQSVILDTKESLLGIVREIDKTLEGDVTSILKREASEREILAEELRIQSIRVNEASDDLMHQIVIRREQLRIRRSTLVHAKAQIADDISHQSEAAEEVTNERTRLSVLHKHFSPTRTALIADLSVIFPIELLSPPDLLFTILSVPLPIPFSASDPAPPLSLLNHKEVTEDVVATALGYAAQVVQILAAYLGKGLIYPVTCVGSRSLIRDGISSMIGPRMFPLFSKGVDTYRFEYGVFLLNKDIEMLMTDRDLRALDMRHTLPNLKNLLLTLTDSEGPSLATPRVPNSSASSASGLESPHSQSRTTLELPPGFQHSTNNLRQSDTDLTDGNTPPSSGATTPTASTHDRKMRSLLGLYPLAGFLRSHYPSVVGRPSVKSVVETSEGALEHGNSVSHSTSDEISEDDEDRRTIRGDTMEGEPEQELKRLANGHSINVEPRQGRKEKSLDEVIPLDFAAPAPASDLG